MTRSDEPKRDTMDVGQPEESELAEKELGTGTAAQTEIPDEDKAEEELGTSSPSGTEVPDEDKAEAELEPLEGGAETMADLDEEGGQADRPGSTRQNF